MKHPKHKEVWLKSCGAKICQLVMTTKMIFFCRKSEIPAKRQKDITYSRILCVYWSKNKDPFCTRITMGGNLVSYPEDCGTPTADILIVKLLLNSVVSTNNAKFMTIDMKDFYLMTTMSRYEYFCMKIDLFPKDIISKYNLNDIVYADGNIFAKSDAECTASPKPGSLCRNSSKNASN
jgi:hypothetical protein